MTAIWPAGPPKVCREIANQARVASESGTGQPAATGMRATADASLIGTARGSRPGRSLLGPKFPMSRQELADSTGNFL